MAWIDEDELDFQVVVNHEEQYSIWPEIKELPAGWTPVGKRGCRDECIQYILEVWTDIKPLSLRKKPAPIARPAFAHAVE